VSTHDEVTAVPITTSKIDTSGDWDEGALAPKMSRTAASAITGGGPTELLDMKALELNRSEQDDIAERMRVEETRAQLAAAKAGMEKEAQRLRENKRLKRQRGKKEKQYNHLDLELPPLLFLEKAVELVANGFLLICETQHLLLDLQEWASEVQDLEMRWLVLHQEVDFRRKLIPWMKSCSPVLQQRT